MLTRSKTPYPLPFLFPPLPPPFSSPSSASECIADAFCLHSRLCAAMGERFWLLNASMLGKTYYPAGKVDPFWLNIALGDTVSYTQVPKKPNLISVCQVLFLTPTLLPSATHFFSRTLILVNSRESGICRDPCPLILSCDLRLDWPAFLYTNLNAAGMHNSACTHDP